MFLDRCKVCRQIASFPWSDRPEPSGVHDELVFEADLDFVDTLLAEVVTRMTSAGALRVPLVVDSGIGDNWDEAH